MRLVTAQIFCLLALMSCAWAVDAPVRLWSRTYGPALGHDAFQPTRDGGYILTYRVQGGATSSDVQLVRTNSAGDTLWTRRYPWTGNDYPNSIAQTTDEGYIVTGFETHFSGNGNILLLKVDANGNQQWVNYFGTSGIDEGECVIQANDGGYVVAGCHFIGPNSVLALWKRSSTGSHQWLSEFGGNNYEWGNVVRETSDGGFYLGAISNSVNHNEYHAYVVRTDADGSMVWERTLGTGSAKDICVTNDNGCVIAGCNNYSLMKLNAAGDTLWISNLGLEVQTVKSASDDGFILTTNNGTLARVDSTGELLWETEPIGAGIADAYQLEEDGGYAVLGYAPGTSGNEIMLARFASELIPEPSGNSNLSLAATAYGGPINYNPPGNAIDGDLETYWNATLNMGALIVALDTLSAIDSVVLHTAMSPAGNARYRISASRDSLTWLVLKDSTGWWTDRHRWPLHPVAAIDTFKYIRIETLASPSWAAWREVELWGRTLVENGNGTIVCGDVYGTWDLEGSPYRVACDIAIPEGQSLTIQAGVTIEFLGPFLFEVNGSLQATGTASDSILFTADTAAAGPWSGIRFNEAATGGHLGYCIVEHAAAENEAPWPDNNGGAIRCFYGSPSFDHCTFRWNTATAGRGGGVWVYSCSPNFSFCEFFGNEAGPGGGGNLGGGGIALENSSALLTNCTVAGNIADWGTGIGLWYSFPEIHNTIVWYNTGLYGSINGLNSGPVVSYSDIQFYTYPGPGNLSCDPNFRDYSNYDFRLANGSPCIDAADPLSPLDPDGSRADMGARPYSRIEDCGPVSGRWIDTGYPYLIGCSLIIPAGDTLVIDPGVEVKFVGDFELRVHGVLIAEGSPQDSILFWTDLAENPDHWGGVRIDSSSGQSRFAYCTFRNGSSVAGDFSTTGGALAVRHSSVRISYCTFEGNQAQWGGALHFASAMNGSRVDSCIFRNNRSVNVGNSGAGGAVTIWDTPVPVVGCLFAGNTANFGGVLEVTGTSSSVTRCTFVENTALSSGSICYGWAGHTVLNSCIFGHNGETSLFRLDGGSTVSVTYSCVADMSGGFANIAAPEGFAVLSTLNCNGDSTDAYFNLFRNPFFTDGDGYTLRWNSSPIDAGDPSLPLDPDWTVADMGWQPYFQPTVIAEPLELDFGSVLPGARATQELQLTNQSAVPARLAGYCRWFSAFSIEDSTFPAWVPPFATITLRLVFQPDSEGVYHDVLTIQSRLAGADELSIQLDAITPPVPLEPESLVVQRGSGYNIELFWSPVTRSTTGRHITPSYYVIYGATDPSGPYLPIGASETTGFVHSSILLTQQRYYYLVSAALGTTLGDFSGAEVSPNTGVQPIGLNAP